MIQSKPHHTRYDKFKQNYANFTSCIWPGLRKRNIHIFFLEIVTLFQDCHKQRIQQNEIASAKERLLRYIIILMI